MQKVYLSQSQSKKLLTWLYLTAQERIRSLTLFQGKLRTFQEARLELNPAVGGALESLTEQVNLETRKSSPKYFIGFINIYWLPTAISSITWPFMKKKIVTMKSVGWIALYFSTPFNPDSDRPVMHRIFTIYFHRILYSAHIYPELVRSSVHVNWQSSINLKRGLPIYTIKVAGL